MTLVVAMLAKDGAVIVADGCASGGSRKTDVQKVFQCGPNVVWAAAGAEPTIQQFKSELPKQIGNWAGKQWKSRNQVEVFRHALRHASAQAHCTVGAPVELAEVRSIDGKTYPVAALAPGKAVAAWFVAAVFVGGEVRLAAVGPDNVAAWHDGPVCGGVAEYAEALVRPYHALADPLPIPQARLAAYDVVSRVCDVAPAGIGMPISVGWVQTGELAAGQHTALWSEADPDAKQQLDNLAHDSLALRESQRECLTKDLWRPQPALQPGPEIGRP